jgi:diacylglycerol kinase family enzyme
LLLQVELAGHVQRLITASLFVCNNRVQLERVGIADEIVRQVGEGRLACLAVRAADLWSKLRMLAAAAFGTLGDERQIDSVAMRSLTVDARGARRLKIATDGEILSLELPLRFTVAPRPLRVMLPPAELRLPAK